MSDKGLNVYFTRAGSWVYYALAAMIFACFYALLIKASTQEMSVSAFLAGVFIIQVPFLALILLLKKKRSRDTRRFKLPAYSLGFCFIFGIFGALGNIFEVYAVEAAPNIGYVSAIKLGQIFIITLLGDFVSGCTNTKISDILWSIGVVVGIFLVSGLGILEFTGIDIDIFWVWYSIGAMLSFSIMILGTKFLSRHMEATTLTFWLIFATAIYFFIYGYNDLFNLIASYNLNLSLMIICSAICIGTFNLLLTRSLELAPNPGFSISITSLQVPLVTIGAVIFFDDQSISILAIIGVIIAMYSSFRIATATRKG